MIEIVAATVAHAQSLGNNLREADAAEITALGFDGEFILTAALGVSSEAWAAVEGDTAVAMWGFSTDYIISDTASIWLLTAPEAVPFAPRLFGVAHRFLDRLNVRFAVLENMADLSYAGAVKLAHRLGFRDYAQIEIGGRAFVRQRRTAEWASSYPH